MLNQGYWPRVRYQKVAIAAVAHELPPRVITSAAIEDRLAPLYERLGLVPGRLEMMTGIRERRAWPEPVSPSAVAARAGAAALAQAAIPCEAIGVLIHASVCRDFLEPATANVVHHRLGLPATAAAFDLSNACLGVVSAMACVANMIELEQIDAGLVVAGENGAPLLQSTIARLLADQANLDRRSIKQSFASLTIGSGAAAILLARRELAPDGHLLLGGVMRSATEHHGLCQGGAACSGPGESTDTGVAGDVAIEMRTDAEALLEAGIALARRTFADFLAALGWSRDGIVRAVTHQVGRAHHRALFAGLDLPEDRGYVTFDRLGNIGSVAVPVALALAAEDGLVTRGQDIALLGIGSGLQSVMLGVRW